MTTIVRGMNEPPEGDPSQVDETRFFRKLRRVLGKIPFAEDILAMYFAMLDSRTPLQAKATIAGAILYFILPLDLIPDVLPGVGYVDDAAVIATALGVVQQHIREGHREQARAWFET